MYDGLPSGVSAAEAPHPAAEREIASSWGRQGNTYGATATASSIGLIGIQRGSDWNASTRSKLNPARSIDARVLSTLLARSSCKDIRSIY